MRPKNEIDAMHVAYEALRGQDGPATHRMLTYLTERLTEEAQRPQHPGETMAAPSAFENYLQSLEIAGAHVDRADPENEAAWRRHFDDGKPASDFALIGPTEMAFRHWLAEVMLLGGRVFQDDPASVRFWRERFDAGHTAIGALQKITLR